MARPPQKAGPPLDRARLHEAALRHLSRFAATEAGLVRVLDRKIGRWARASEAEGNDCAAAVAQARSDGRLVARSLVEAGVVNDAAFAAARAQRLTRAGRSRRAVSAHLLSKGIAGDLVETVLPAAEQEVPSALAYARRRRLGPFRAHHDPEAVLRDLGALARAGFSREVAERVLATTIDEAEAAVIALKRG